MNTLPPSPTLYQHEKRAQWQNRAFLALTILCWLIIIGILLWFLAQSIQVIVLLIISTLFASLLMPLIRVAQRFMPRVLAILVLCLLLLISLALLLYSVSIELFRQIIAFVAYLRSLLVANGDSSLRDSLPEFHLTPEQKEALRHELLQPLQSGAFSLLALLNNLTVLVSSFVIVAVLSVYFLLDGERIINWLRHETPFSQRPWVRFGENVLAKTIGGSLRGQILLIILTSVLIGTVVALFGVPFGVLVGVLTLFFQFIPVVGPIFIILFCCLLTFAQGWLVMLFLAFVVLAILTIKQVIILIISPSLLGRIAGLHPIVALSALLLGTRLFGVWGALFALPVASFLQRLLVNFWLTWRSHHPEEFFWQSARTVPAPQSE